MLTLLLVVALVVLLVVLGWQSDRTPQTKVVELIEFDDDEGIVRAKNVEAAGVSRVAVCRPASVRGHTEPGDAGKFGPFGDEVVSRPWVKSVGFVCSIEFGSCPSPAGGQMCLLPQFFDNSPAVSYTLKHSPKVVVAW